MACRPPKDIFTLRELRPRSFALLQAIAAEPGLHSREFDDVTGWSWCAGEASILKELGLIMRYGERGRYQATEKGKIVLAISIGKAMRQRLLCKAA